jgi:dTDP-4-amino-4,6-dideoxygalactose transaminase
MSERQAIPFLDLVGPHRELREELLQVVNSAFDTGGFIGGPMVQGFEADFAKFCETEHCVGVGSGTDALRFALIAAGVGPGDVAITVPNTFIATTEAISQAGARPVFVDIDEVTCNMDPRKLTEYIEIQCDFDPVAKRLVDAKTGDRVAAIVPVHLYGQTADMDPILEIAERYNLVVIEDACQAHGAEYFSTKEQRWRRAGSMGRAAAFSFYPGKNLGACGEGGAITTSDAALAQKMRMLRDHGQAQKYYHDIEGYNGRLDAIQAGILRVKLKCLPAWTEMRRAAAARYAELFKTCGSDVLLPYEPGWTKSVYHLFVVRTPDREQIMKDLAAVGVGTGIHYPIPLHLQKAYGTLGYRRGDFPVAEKVAEEIVSLPMFPGLKAEQQEWVVSQVIAFVSQKRLRENALVELSALVSAQESERLQA